MALANRLACFVISSCSSRGYDAKMSYFVPIRTGMAVWAASQRCAPRSIPNARHVPY